MSIYYKIDDGEHFAAFTKTLKGAIAKYGDLDEHEVMDLQKTQVKTLAKLEKMFRKELMKDPNGLNAYNFFLSYILDDKKNILAARPFFRERKTVFSQKVTDAIRDRNIEVLQTTAVNYHFINLVKKKFTFTPEVESIIKQICDVRHGLVIMNLPIVINRSRIFWSKITKTHLSFMDLVQVATEGLISGVDKYCGEYSRMWCGVAIGRIVGNLIDAASSTLIHFYPADKRKLYRANKFKARHLHGDYEIQDLVDEVARGLNVKVDKDDIIGLISASSMVSADTVVGTNPNNIMSIHDNIANCPAPESQRPDTLMEITEVQSLVGKAIKGLSIFDQKLLRLKGVGLGIS